MRGQGSRTISPADSSAMLKEQLAQALKLIEDAWIEIKSHGGVPEKFHLIHQIAQKITDFSITLGFSQIRAASQAVSCRFGAERAHQDSPDEVRPFLSIPLEQIAIIEAELADLTKAIRHELRAGTGLPAGDSSIPSPTTYHSRSSQTIFLVDCSPLVIRELSDQIGYFGYSVQSFAHPSSLDTALVNSAPLAIITEIVFPEGEEAGIDSILSLRQRNPDTPPVIFTSTRVDLYARLRSVRAGGTAYFSKPVNIARLIDTLDRIMKAEHHPPYKVLVVDDVAVQAHITARHLTAAGMEANIITDPFRIIEALEEFNPELILLDVYMPGCTGLELAEVIRQMDSFISIPIVFYSAETDRDKQLHAIGLGGDDFLTKPMRPDYLASAVASRIERYRQLNTLMVRDSLTGAFNHTTISELFSRELSRASRQGTPLSYVMIDLDFFKSVNDLYGHAAGDRVLRSLVHLLKNRLRLHDIVGRYGGEEFAVVLPTTTAFVAEKIMNELRKDFAMVRHQSGDISFTVSFSCGIAEYPCFAAFSQIRDAADKALYQAKLGGRNRVVLADGCRPAPT